MPKPSSKAEMYQFNNPGWSTYWEQKEDLGPQEIHQNTKYLTTRISVLFKDLRLLDFTFTLHLKVQQARQFHLAAKRPTSEYLGFIHSLVSDSLPLTDAGSDGSGNWLPATLVQGQDYIFFAPGLRPTHQQPLWDFRTHR